MGSLSVMMEGAGMSSVSRVCSSASSASFGSGGEQLRNCVVSPPRLAPPRPLQLQGISAKSGSDSGGIFAPAVVITRNIVGAKRFNQLRGKAIALHSQVITEFCKSIGADSKVRQGLIRIAKKNGEKLGFLA